MQYYRFWWLVQSQLHIILDDKTTFGREIYHIIVVKEDKRHINNNTMQY